MKLLLCKWKDVAEWGVWYPFTAASTSLYSSFLPFNDWPLGIINVDVISFLIDWCQFVTSVLRLDLEHWTIPRRHLLNMPPMNHSYYCSFNYILSAHVRGLSNSGETSHLEQSSTSHSKFNIWIKCAEAWFSPSWVQLFPLVHLQGSAGGWAPYDCVAEATSVL